MPISRACPSCHDPMYTHTLASVAGGHLELDLCFACRGLWFDPQENLKLSPAAVVELFKLLHAHRHEGAKALPQQLSCPHCRRALVQGFDVVKSGRYITHRCPQRHGRFSSFAAFMIEKGFVRQLSTAEINDMAQRLKVINCSNCGAPVDLRTDHACPYCRSALSLLDPQAVERALVGYESAARAQGGVQLPQLADALVMLERDRQQAARDAKANQSGRLVLGDDGPSLDLWAAGLALVWAVLN
ncbi:zf-TFIIB domain-containing protein [Rhodoferax sp. U11-2br]|uniref:zf-TFIIB domain-containing protein n=1 Tax=Rhodoferax sp. U11-2br TaxID=2838878 RepID=UPI001BE8F1D3|nr:zf-TFIIB domain-containing protein [Rhodoferax sp. U11-2br]MBT3067309.1 zf-TFIIB domain-containing protein [Rhodoferax sp. U11-2br]